MGRTEIAPEIKAAALADLLFMSSAAVAAKYDLSPKTVSVWKSRELPQQLTPTVVVEEKRARVGALLYEYLEANLNAQIAQAYAIADPTYIKRQSAGELAILHGVLNDKLVRVVDALRPGAPAAPGTSE